MKNKKHFGPELFKFLRDLAKHNNRAWFLENKERYERDVKFPLLSFIGDFGPLLKKIAPHYISDPRPSGGSMFRIYRDARFSTDKSPYKTHASAQFRHTLGKDVHAPGFYLHLEPGEVFGAAGMWQPDPPALHKVRTAIAEKSDEFKKILNAKKFKAVCAVGGDSLVRPPKGFDPNHPLIEELKHKDFVNSTDFSEKDATSAGFIDKFAAYCEATSKYMQFLTEALGLEY